DAAAPWAFAGQAAGHVGGGAGRRAAEARGGARLGRPADGGRSFTTPVTVATGLLDPPSLAADRWARSGPATLYIAGDYFGRGGLAFTRSTDGGRSFEPLRFPDPGSDPNGGPAPARPPRPGGPAAVALLCGAAPVTHTASC